MLTAGLLEDSRPPAWLGLFASAGGLIMVGLFVLLVAGCVVWLVVDARDRRRPPGETRGS